MSNKQPKRQKCQPKLYTESDMRRIQREAMMNIEAHHMKLTVGAFALALHRILKLPKDQIVDVLAAAGEYTNEALCYTDVRKELLDEAGLDIQDFVEVM